MACPQCGIQTQRRQLRAHQQFTCPASHVAGTAPSARALQHARKQAGSLGRGRGRGRGSLSSSVTVAAPSALTASQRGVEVWSTEEYVDILRGGGPQPPARRRGNQCTAHVELTCIFCSRTAAQLGRVNVRTHQLSCHQRRLDLIRADFVRQCLKKHRSVDMISWSLPCPHCGVPFPSTTMRRTHITSCLRRYQQNCQPTDRYSEQLGPEVLAERLRFFRAQVEEALLARNGSSQASQAMVTTGGDQRQRASQSQDIVSLLARLAVRHDRQIGELTDQSAFAIIICEKTFKDAVLAERRQWQQQRPSEASSPHPSGSSQRVVVWARMLVQLEAGLEQKTGHPQRALQFLKSVSPAVVEHSVFPLKPKFNEPHADEQRPWVWLLSVGIRASQQFREALAFLAASDTKFSNCAVAPSKTQDGPIVDSIQGWLKKGSGEVDTKSKRARRGGGRGA